MNKADADSFVAEALGMPRRCEGLLSNFFVGAATTQGYGMLDLSPSAIDQIRSGIEHVVIRTKSSLSGIYPTLGDLLKFSALGVETVRSLTMGLGKSGGYNDLGDTPIGQRLRENDGKRFVRTGATYGSRKPTTLPIHIGQWKRRYIDFDTKSITADRREATLVEVDGDDSLRTIRDLDDFLQGKTYYYDWEVLLNNASNFIGNIPFGQVQHNCEAIRWNQYCAMPRYSGRTIFYGALPNGPREMYSHAVDNTVQNSITARVFLEEAGREPSEVFTQTISSVGMGVVWGMTDFKKHYFETGSRSYLTYEEYNQIVELISKADDLVVVSVGELTAQQQRELEVQREISQAADDFLATMHCVGRRPYRPLFGHVYAEGYNLHASYIRHSTFFLKKGVKYRFRIALDNVYTPLTISQLATNSLAITRPPIKCNMP